MKSNTLGWVLVLFCVIFLLFLVGGYMGKKQVEKANQEALAEVSECIEEGYSCYYNGTEIDINNVNILDYKYTIDDEKKSIYLTDAEKLIIRRYPFIVY